VFYECNITEIIDSTVKKVESSTKYKEVRLGETLHEIFSHPSFVIPQYPVFTIISKDFPLVKNYYL